MSEESEARADSIDAYGALAALDLDPTVQAGRYAFQAEAERRVPIDLLPKLRPEAHHRYLDIGCGAGMLLIPFSYLMREAVGLDHPDIVAKLASRLPHQRIALIAGSFPDTPVPGSFDRITVYSVIHCLPTLDSAISFSLAAAALLAPGGRMVLGDIPNKDRQGRFRDSEAGRAFEQEWSKQKSRMEADETAIAVAREFGRAQQMGGFTDRQLCDLMLALRSAGFEAWPMEQSPDLPFGRTREDLVVTRA